jgi:zinc/manganese transport system ATP-binding protein
VLTAECLSELYGTRIDVLRVRGRVVVVGTPDGAHGEGSHHHHAVGDDHDLEHAAGTGRSSWV